MRSSPRLALRLTALAAGLVCLHAQAQQAPASTEQLQRIEITGSNIKRINTESAVPIQVITREQIEASGVTTVKGLIDELAASTGGLSDIEGANRFSPGASAISLRNLGAQATLLLLNGRRVAPYGLADYATLFSNVDSLPLEAIERIEVLKSGASAIYGSDAVAGVINVITRRDYKGTQLSGWMANSLNTTQFGEKGLSFVMGRGDIVQDRYNVVAMVSAYQRDPLFYSDIISDTNPELTKYSPSYGTPSSFSWPGNIIGQGPLAGCTDVRSNLCMYNRYERFQAIPSADRLNLMVNARYALNADTELFFESMYSRTEVDYFGAHQIYGGPSAGTTTWGDPSTNTSKIFRYVLLPTTHPLNKLGRPAELRYRFIDSNAGSSVKADEYRVLGGAKGTINNYDWEVALQHLGSKAVSTSRGSFSETGFKEVIGNWDNPGADFFNRGYKIGETNSPEVLNKLFPTYGYTGKISQTALDGKVSGELMKLPAGQLAFAAGGEIRNESVSIDPTQNLRRGDIVGNGLSAADASRTFYAAFGELSIPVMKGLEAQVAARLDKFPGFDAHLSPKLAVRYQPSKELLFRGTIENGFRAPNLTESAESTKFAFQRASDPKRCGQALNLRADLVRQAQALPASDPNRALLLSRADSVQTAECGSVALITKNNPNLKPETAKSHSLGIVLEPINNVSVSLDYWSINRKDEISARSASRILTEEGAAGSPEVLRNSLASDTTFTAAEQARYGVTAGRINALLRNFVNLNRTKTDGVDAEFRLRTETPLGRLTTQLTATYLNSLYSWNTTTNQWSHNYAGFYEYPRLRTNVSFTLRMPKWTHGVSFISNTGSKGLGYSPTDTFCKDYGISEGDCKWPGNTVTNYFVSYTGVKNLSVQLNVNNVFNKLGQLDVRSFVEPGGIIPAQFADSMKASYRLSATYKF